MNPIPPFDTWTIQLPNAVGTYTCEGTAIPTFLNYAFVDTDGSTVLWDTEQSGGADCTVTVERAAPEVGDVIEGTFSGVLGDGLGNGHMVTGGSFRIRRDS